ncbi:MULTISPECIES: hypothetical protein [Methylobacteriaceae]
MQVMFGKHVIEGRKAPFDHGLYRDRGWVIGGSFAAGDHAGHRS